MSTPPHDSDAERLICPETIQSQVERLCIGLTDTLSANLVGIYLHGSLALGCFNPERSDMDLLVVTATPMEAEIKRDVAALLLRVSNDPCPVEITFVTRHALGAGIYPVPFDLHYGEEWRRQTQEQLADGSWLRWNEVQRQDPDLAGQIAVTRERGLCLQGEPIVQVLPRVPPETLRDCFLLECDWALERIVENPVYGILNPCRAWTYLIEGRLLSKAEGGDWALQRLPEPYRALVAHALAVYRGTTESEDFEASQLEAFAAFFGNLATAARLRATPPNP